MELDIGDDLHRKLARRAEVTGFDSVEDYSVFVLQTVVGELYDERDEAIEGRLEDLGYL